MKGISKRRFTPHSNARNISEGVSVFIIPATLEPCDRLEELDHLNRAELTDDAGINCVARDILADWASRQKKQGE